MSLALPDFDLTFFRTGFFLALHEDGIALLPLTTDVNRKNSKEHVLKLTHFVPIPSIRH